MKILRKSLFVQHLVIMFFLIALFLGFFYEFSISFANKNYKNADQKLEQIDTITSAFIAYDIKLNKGKIKKKNLESFIENLQTLNPVLKQISIFDSVSGKEIIAVGDILQKKPFQAVDEETRQTVFISPPQNISLLDNLSYQLLGFTYSKILHDKSSYKSSNKPRQIMIINKRIENIQIQMVSSFSDFEKSYIAYMKSTILGFFTFLLMIITFFLYSHFKVIVPLKKLKKGALEIAKGNLRSKVHVNGSDEIGIVGTFFNEVSRNLRDITTELYEKDRLKGEVNIASRIQESLIPPQAPDIPGLDIQIGYKTAEEVGGDSLDFVQVDDNNMLMYIGDVSGHGIPAGLVMTMVDILVHGFSDVYSDISTLMINLNKHITPKIDASMFMTLLMMNWNHTDQKFTYVGGGHESIIYYKAASREIEVIKPGGIAIGMIDDNSPLVQVGEIRPEVGDVLVLYTDGIPEARGGEDGREFYGTDRFQEAIAKYAVQSTSELIFESITEDLSRHMGNTKQADDITLIVIKYTGVSMSEKSIRLSIDKKTYNPENRSGKWNWNK